MFVSTDLQCGSHFFTQSCYADIEADLLTPKIVNIEIQFNSKVTVQDTTLFLFISLP